MTKPLSDAELDIMQIIWAQPGPVLFAELMTQLAAQGKRWQKNTVITLLARLMDKGFLSAQKTGRRNAYTALVSQQSYQTVQTRCFVDKLFAGQAGALVNHLVASELLTDEEYAQLKALLEEGGDQRA